MDHFEAGAAQAKSQGKHMLYLSMGLGIVSVVSCFAMAAAHMPAEPIMLSSGSQSVQSAAVNVTR